MEQLFIYGTLQEEDVQHKVFGRLTPLTPARLDNYERSTIELNGRTYFIAVPKPNNHIMGSVISITPEELQKADVYETSAYKRVLVTLADGTQAWLYQK